jgi:hypothetical protein
MIGKRSAGRFHRSFQKEKNGTFLYFLTKSDKGPLWEGNEWTRKEPKMTNAMTKKPLRVWAEETEWPWIPLPVSQLDEVRRILDERSIRYTVDEHYVSLNDGPFTTIIKLQRGTDGKAVQAVLDSVG